MTVIADQAASDAAGGGQDRSAVMQGLSLVVGSTLTVLAVIGLAPGFSDIMIVFRDVPNAHFWVPALVGVTGLGAAIFSPFAGLIGDRFGRRLPLIGFCVLFSVAGLAPLVLDDFAPIFASRAIVGIAYMGVLVLSTAMIGDRFTGASRGRWLAAQAMVASSSALLILPLSGFLAGWLGWRGPFWLFLAGLPLALAYWLLFDREAAEVDTSHSQVAWSALPWRWLVGICLVSAFSGIFFYTVQLQIGLALAAVGVADAARIGLLSGIAIIGVPVGALLFVKLADHPFARLMGLELFVAGATLMMMRHAGDYRVFVLIAFIHLIACGMIVPTLLTHVNRHLEGAVRARGIGVWQAAFSAGNFLSVGACGLLMRRSGATILDAFWVVGLTAVAVIAIASLVMLGRRKIRIQPRGEVTPSKGAGQ
jgi:MFS family permease